MARSEPIVVIGASAGGVTALRRLLAGIRADLPCAVVIVLHVGDHDIAGLLALIGRSSRLPVVEAQGGAPVAAGQVYLAPGNYHLLLERECCFSLSVDERVCYARPSIDVLFASAADAYGAGAIGVILTGANEDGAEGLAAIRRRGGRALVQRPEEAEAPQMPRAALRVAGADATLDLDGIATWINREFD